MESVQLLDVGRLLFSVSWKITVLLVCFLIGQYFYNWSYYKVLDKIPGPKGHPILGVLPMFLNRIKEKGPTGVLELSIELMESHGGFYRTWAPFDCSLNACDCEHVREILKLDPPKGTNYKFLHPWLGWSLLTSSGTDWKRKRRMLTPAFHFQILHGYVDIFCKYTEKLIKTWKIHAQRSEEFDIFPDFTALTLDIIGICAFNYDIGALDKQGSPYVKAIYEVSELAFKRSFDPLFAHHDTAYRYLTSDGRKFYSHLNTIHELPYRIIRQRKEEMKDPAFYEKVSQKKYKDFLDLLMIANMKEENPLSDEEIRAEVDTFMFEGHDTTAAALGWAIYVLALYPHIQQKVQKEVDSIIGDKWPSYDDLEKMTYLGMVMKETLRLYPSVPYITRMTDKKTDICGYEVPANTELFISPYALHRNKKIWGPNAEEFNPENFHPDKPLPDPFAFVPFSGGNRNCIGQNFAFLEEKSILSLILRNFNINLVKSHPVVTEPHLILRPQHGIKVTLTVRQ